jgi:hypothetical protein
MSDPRYGALYAEQAQDYERQQGLAALGEQFQDPAYAPYVQYAQTTGDSQPLLAFHAQRTDPMNDVRMEQARLQNQLARAQIAKAQRVQHKVVGESLVQINPDGSVGLAYRDPNPGLDILRNVMGVDAPRGMADGGAPPGNAPGQGMQPPTSRSDALINYGLATGDMQAVRAGAQLKGLEIEQQQAASETGNRVLNASLAGGTVLQDVGRAIELLDEYGGSIAGPAAIVGDMPIFGQSSTAGQLAGHIESVKSNVGIDALLRIKASGAGLGQVPQTQLETLQSLLGRLDPYTDPKITRDNLARISNLYASIISKGKSDLERLTAQGVDTGVDLNVLSSIDRYKPYSVSFDEFGRSTPQPAPTAQPAQGEGPVIGTIEDGYEFIGGNPADPKSWRKAQ